jgi:hypothetical protein
MGRILLLFVVVFGLVLIATPADVQAGQHCDGKVCRVVTAPVRVVVAPIRAIRSRCAACNVCTVETTCVQKTETCVQKAEVCHVARAGLCWYPGKLLIQRRRAAKATGGWYLGKNVGRVRCCH